MAPDKSVWERGFLRSGPSRGIRWFFLFTFILDKPLWNMVNRRDIFTASIIISLITGVLVSPAVPLIFGLGILFVIWGAEGGMSYGNPHRRRMLEDRRAAINRDVHQNLERDMSAMPDRAKSYLLLTGAGLVAYAFVLIEFF